jgi:hypothetical protein
LRLWIVLLLNRFALLLPQHCTFRNIFAKSTDKLTTDSNLMHLLALNLLDLGWDVPACEITMAQLTKVIVTPGEEQATCIDSCCKTVVFAAQCNVSKVDSFHA